jgi:hypothetical protein
MGYGQVWQRLVAGLDGLGVAVPSEAAVRGHLIPFRDEIPS